MVMAVFAGDHPAFVRSAFASLQQQSLPPSEILIAVDGPVGPELEETLGRFSRCESVRILRLPQNAGPGMARDLAIRKASHDIVAIMDADDICDPRRFERQIAVIRDRGTDLVGAWIEEFRSCPGDLGRIRKTPPDHEEICRYGRWRQPVNNVTAVFRRSAYLAAGGYGPFRYVEDYDLIVRMLVKGFVLRNVPEVLVYVRAGGAYVARRQGWRHLKEELQLYGRMYRWRYIRGYQLAANCGIRLMLRLFPSGLLGRVYKRFLRNDAPPAR